MHQNYKMDKISLESILAKLHIDSEGNYPDPRCVEFFSSNEFNDIAIADFPIINSAIALCMTYWTKREYTRNGKTTANAHGETGFKMGCKNKGHAPKEDNKIRLRDSVQQSSKVECKAGWSLRKTGIAFKKFAHSDDCLEVRSESLQFSINIARQILNSDKISRDSIIEKATEQKKLVVSTSDYQLKQMVKKCVTELTGFEVVPISLSRSMVKIVKDNVADNIKPEYQAKHLLSLLENDNNFECFPYFKKFENNELDQLQAIFYHDKRLVQNFNCADAQLLMFDVTFGVIDPKCGFSKISHNIAVTADHRIVLLSTGFFFFREINLMKVTITCDDCLLS